MNDLFVSPGASLSRYFRDIWAKIWCHGQICDNSCKPVEGYGLSETYLCGQILHVLKYLPRSGCKNIGFFLVQTNQLTKEKQVQKEAVAGSKLHRKFRTKTQFFYFLYTSSFHYKMSFYFQSFCISQSVLPPTFYGSVIDNNCWMAQTGNLEVMTHLCPSVPTFYPFPGPKYSSHRFSFLHLHCLHSSQLTNIY